MASVGQELLNVPFPEMIESMGMAIARAQHALDMNSVRMAQIMSGGDWLDEDEEGNEILRPGMKVSFGGRMLSLLELGFTPTFYQFVDTIIEVKISVSMKSETAESRSSTNVNSEARGRVGWGKVSASMSISTVSASFSARNSFSAEGASLIRTKLVPLPPPAVLTDRVKALMEDAKRKEMTLEPVVLELTFGKRERERSPVPTILHLSPPPKVSRLRFCPMTKRHSALKLRVKCRHLKYSPSMSHRRTGPKRA